MKALKILLTMVLTMLVLSVGASAATLNSVAETYNEGTAISSVLPGATDIVGTPTYSLTGMPAGASFTASTRTFTWTPDYSDSSVYTMTYGVTDDNGPAPSTNYVLTISDYNPIQMSDVLLGGPNQHRTNPESDSDSDRREVNAETTFTITNDGAIPVTITLAVTKDSSFTYSYNISWEGITPGTAITLNANEARSIKVRGFVPDNLPSFFPERSDYSDRKVKMANLGITSTTGGVGALTKNLHMEAENMLDFNKLYVYVNGDSTRVSSDGKEVDDIRPGDEIEVKAILENHYKDNDDEDLEIQDVELTIEIGEELDIDEEIDFDDLDPEEDDAEESVTFDIDIDDVEDQDYDMFVILDGEDENGAYMGVKYKVIMQVQKKSHEIAIDRLRLTPTTAVCKTSAQLEFNLVNIGKRNEDETAYKVESVALGLAKSEYDIDLDSRDDVSRRITIPLEGVKTGDYDIEVTAFYNRNEPTDTEVITLHVQDCEPVSSDDDSSSDSADDTTDAQASGDAGSDDTAPVTIVPEMDSFDEFQGSTTYTLLLGGLVLLLAVMLILLLIKFVF